MGPAQNIGVLFGFLLCFGLTPVASDGNLTSSGYDVDGNLFKEAGLTRRFDPQDSTYILHLVWIAMPGVVLAIIALIWGLVLFFGNTVCSCCKVDAHEKVGRETRGRQLCISVVILALGSLVAISGTIIGWVSTNHIQSASKSAVGDFATGVTKYHDVVKEAKNSYRAFNPNPMLPLNVSVNGTYAMTKTADAALRGVERSMSELTKFFSTVKAKEPIYTFGYIWGFRATVLLASLTTLMSAIGANLARTPHTKPAARKCVGFWAWFSFPVIVLVWTVFAAHLDLAAVVTDSCPVVNNEMLKLSTRTQANPGAGSDDLRYLLTCLGAGDTTLLTAVDEVKKEYHVGMDELMRRGADVADTSTERVERKHKDMERLGLHTERLKKVLNGLEAASDCRILQPHYFKSVSSVCDVGFQYILYIIGVTGCMGLSSMAVAYAVFKARAVLLLKELKTQERSPMLEDTDELVGLIADGQMPTYL